MRRALLVALLMGASLVPASSAAAAPSYPPIQHLVVVVEQNSTFDHTFGTLTPYGINGMGQHERTTEPQQDELSRTHVQPFSRLVEGRFFVETGEELLNNGVTAATTAFNSGRMNGFYRAQDQSDKDTQVPFSVMDKATPSPWRRLTDRAVVFDNYFSSALGGSLPNTLNLVAGTSDGFTDSSRSSLLALRNRYIPTIFDSAAGKAGVTWSYYVGGLSQLDPIKIENGDYARSKTSAPSQLYWAPILSMSRFWDSPYLSPNIRSQNDFFDDAAAGTLPNITYLLPQPTTHEPRVLSPDLRVLSIVNALRTSPDWPSTAVLFVWDDWGGYYDHVPPPEKEGQQLGFRVPMMLLSPYAVGDTVSHKVLDHSSIPKLAASLFQLDGYSEGRTTFPSKVFTNTPTGGDRIVALTHQARYEALGNQHSSSVFILYLLTIVMITGVLFVVGVTLRSAPNQDAPT